MSGKKKWTRRAAIGLIGTGAGLFALNTGAATQIYADREVGFGIKPDDEALVILRNLEQQGEVPVIENQLDSKAEVTLSVPSESSPEFDVGNDGKFEAGSASFLLLAGKDKEWTVSASTDPVSVHILVEFGEDGDNPLTVDLIRDVVVSQSGQFDLGIKTKSPGGSGKLDFKIENNGSREAEIIGIRVDDTNNERAVNISPNNNGNDTFIVGGKGNGTTLISDQTLIIGASEITEFDDGKRAKISSGETREFSFRRFRDANGDTVNMKDTIVDITLQFGDGSLRQFELDFSKED